MFHTPVSLTFDSREIKYKRSAAQTDLKIYIPYAARLSEHALLNARQVEKDFMVGHAAKETLGSFALTAIFGLTSGTLAAAIVFTELFLLIDIVLGLGSVLAALVTLIASYFTVDGLINTYKNVRVERADTRGVKGYLSDDIRFAKLGIDVHSDTEESARIKHEIASNSKLGQTFDDLIAAHMSETSVLVDALKVDSLSAQKREELEARLTDAAQGTLEDIRKAIKAVDDEADDAKSVATMTADTIAQSALDATLHLVKGSIITT